MQRLWNSLKIKDCGEPLVALPSLFARWQPHPYAVLGAPYPVNACPFRLRQAVVLRLVAAQKLLQRYQPDSCLLIFDAWRPIAVQQYMVEWSLAQPGTTPAAVNALWAPPSTDPLTPPPHSTGSAVDLCLASRDGKPLPMGGEIDAMGAIAEPQHFSSAPLGTEEANWHRNRTILANAMGKAGFSQHPNEWWHFSYGDQMWAWNCGVRSARYGVAACL
jgi:D-alanyl-D-alanine dipeptidase